MKNKFLFTFVILLTLSACKKDNNPIKAMVLGTWLQVDWNTKVANPSSYLKFYSDYKLESNVLNLSSYNSYGTSSTKLILFQDGRNVSLSNKVTVAHDTLTIIPDTYCISQYGHGCSTLFVRQK